jgi:glutamate 5-kinase
MHRQIREKLFKNCSKVVIKVGTRLLTDINRIHDVVSHAAFLKKKGCQVILVSSGAVGLGMKTLGLKKRPSELSEVQALASVGQSKLMSLYETECAKYGFHCAQLLLGADDIRDRKRHLNVMNCLKSLLSKDILPIINENDAVSVEELKFGDNDTLAALIAVMIKADLTLILTTVEGLMTDNSGRGKRLPVVEKIDENIKKIAGGTDGNSFSIGGMASKLKAAEIITKAGEYMMIADGRDPQIVEKIFAGEDHGTLFVPKTTQMKAKKRWLGFFSQTKGSLIIDDGAVIAIIEKGKSLLPPGIKNVENDFDPGDCIDICDKNGKVIARGLSNYSSCEIRKIAGKKTFELKKIIGQNSDDEVVHRNNMALLF